MSWAYFLPFLFGAMAVLQGGLNRLIARHWGLAGTVFLNSLMLTTAGLALYLFARHNPQALPAIFRDKGSFSSFSWWFVIPGLCGFTLVTGLPFAIQKLGALKVFVGLIAAQLIVSMIWDAHVEQLPVTSTRMIGAALSFCGALLVAWKG